ncbi:hypothetical protein D3C72_2461720 [compost metagenome]
MASARPRTQAGTVTWMAVLHCERKTSQPTPAPNRPTQTAQKLGVQAGTLMPRP